MCRRLLPEESSIDPNLSTVLNPVLYSRLVAAFGRVRVSSRGEAMLAHPSVDPVSGRPRLVVVQGGEYYRVDCPYCGDTRARLWVSHRYGTEDAGGRKLRFLAHCYNRLCLREKWRADDFRDRLDDGYMLARARVREGIVVAAEDRAATMPGHCIRLDRLPDAHPAVRYISERPGQKLDYRRLGRAYGLSFCTDAPNYNAVGRLIAPVVLGGKLVGWQGRYPADLDWKGPRRNELPPKYYTDPAMRASQVLYNLDVARTFRTIVVVEGTFDVYGFGPMCAATFGSSLSDAQVRLLKSIVRDCTSVVLLYDDDAYLPPKADPTATPSGLVAAGKLRAAFGDSAVALSLPKGTDPGSAPRRTARAFVAAEAAKKGVTVSWEKT